MAEVAQKFGINLTFCKCIGVCFGLPVEKSHPFHFQSMAKEERLVEGGTPVFTEPFSLIHLVQSMDVSVLRNRVK